MERKYRCTMSPTQGNYGGKFRFVFPSIWFCVETIIIYFYDSLPDPLEDGYAHCFLPVILWLDKGMITKRVRKHPILLHPAFLPRKIPNGFGNSSGILVGFMPVVRSIYCLASESASFALTHYLDRRPFWSWRQEQPTSTRVVVFQMWNLSKSYEWSVPPNSTVLTSRWRSNLWWQQGSSCTSRSAIWFSWWQRRLHVNHHLCGASKLSLPQVPCASWWTTQYWWVLQGSHSWKHEKGLR